jgi:two-component system cell cycle sensor histidine kinase/response regulator CckA
MRFVGLQYAHREAGMVSRPRRRTTDTPTRPSSARTHGTAPARPRSRQQQALRRDRDVLSHVMDVSPAGIVRLDREGRIVFANGRAEQVLRLTRDEIGGRSYDDPQWRILDHDGGPFDQERLPFHAVKRTGQAVYDVRHAIELADGRRVLLSVNAAPLLDERGGFDGVVATVEDVTERVHAERTLRETTEELDRFFSLALDLLCIADMSGRFLRLNRSWEEVLGYSTRELEGRPFLDFVHPDDRAATEAAVSRLSDGEPVLNFVNRYRREDGSHRWIEWRSLPYQKRLIYAAGRDITDRQEAAARLERSESRYRFFMENLPGIAYQFDARRSRLLFLHGAVEEITGHPPADFLEGRIDWKQVIHRDDRSLVEGAARRLFTEPTRVVDNEYRIVRADGAVRWLRDVGQGAALEQGAPTLVNGLLWDVTERRRADETQRADEARLRSIFRASPTGIGLVVNRVLQQVNERICEMTGYSMEELVGQSARILYPSPEEFEYVGRAKYAQIERAGIGSVETRWLRKDGRIIDVLMSSVPLDPGALSAGVTFTALDITERKRAMEDLARVQALLMAAIEHSPAGILIADAPDLRIHMANSAALAVGGSDAASLAETPEDLHPQHWRVFHPDGRPFAPEEMPLSRAVRKGETVRNVEAIVRRPDGEARWVLASAAPVRDAGGKIVAGIVVVPDITDIKRAAEEHERLQAQVQHVQKLESLGVLAGGIAHDFNNMLMAILGNADLAMRSLSPVSPAQAFLREIETASRRSADLCRQMLAYSGKGRFVVEPLNLNEVVREMTRMLEVSISKTAVLKFNLAHNLPSVEADATQVRQVLMNLMTNASEAIGERSGSISISTGAMRCDRGYLTETYLSEPLATGTFVYVEVADTGCGMTPEVKTKIFDPFFTTKFTGRGLGMAAVLGIVRGHKGAIKIYSEPGRGTTIKVLLPASEKLAPRSEGEGDSGGEWRGSGTILVADDDQTVRLVTEEMLRMMGFEVIVAHDGRAALETFRERHAEITCVLLDLTMPHMDGEEAYREMRRVDGDVRVVMTSGYNEQEVTQRFVGKGLAGFIQKPFQFDALRAKLRSVLGD